MIVPRHTPTDSYPTETSDLQAATEDTLLNHIPDGSSQPPNLQKNAHMQFLARNLIQGFPSRYISQDASQPWLMFWTLQSFSFLQVALDPDNKQRCVPFLPTVRFSSI
jgi:protein farnesyltransferase subunit beta